MKTPEITDYLTVGDYSISGLEIAVMRQVKEGYTPLGGLAIAPSGHNGGKTYFYQTMVKYKTE